MATHHKIVGSEAFGYSSGRLSPGIGAIRVFPEQNQFWRALAWMRWWHWAALVFAALLIIDQRF